MVLRNVLKIILLALVLSGCGEPVLFISDPVLEQFEGNFLLPRAFSLLRMQRVVYKSFKEKEEFNNWIASQSPEAPYKTVVASPLYINEKSSLSSLSSTGQILYLNVNPEDTEISVFTDWSLIDKKKFLSSLDSSGEIIPLIYMNDPLSYIHAEHIKTLFSEDIDIEEQKITLHNWKDILDRMDLDEVHHILLISSEINQDIMSYLSKWDIPMSGEIWGAEEKGYSWNILIRDDWKKMVSQALAQAARGEYFSKPIPPELEINHNSKKNRSKADQ